MILFENVTLANQDDQIFLKNFSTVINSGEKVALIGASGSGKSSLLRCAVGGVSNWHGRIVVDGFAVSASTIHSIRKLCGYIPQEPRLPGQTVRLFLEEFFSALKLNWQGQIGCKVLEACNYLLLPEDIFDLDCRKLSGGQRQRLAIASIAALERKILLADEITSALDKESKQRVIDLLFDSKSTILSVSHDSGWCEHCDRVIDITKESAGI